MRTSLAYTTPNDLLANIIRLLSKGDLTGRWGIDSWMTVEAAFQDNPSQRHTTTLVISSLKKGALKDEIQIVQHLFVDGQFHINDMTITCDEKRVCLVAAAVLP